MLVLFRVGMEDPSGSSEDGDNNPILGERETVSRALNGPPVSIYDLMGGTGSDSGRCVAKKKTPTHQVSVM